MQSRLIKTFDELELYEITVPGYEKILHFQNISQSVCGIIAIHSTLRGPALGGCRFTEYPSFAEGLKDVLQLAEAMTYKNAIVDLPYGGGKCVIFKTPYTKKSAFVPIFSKVLNYLDGKYLTADDVGTSVQDMEHLRKLTPHAKGIEFKNSQVPATSYGVYQALKAAYHHRTGLDNLRGLRVIIEGLGKTGYTLCKFLHQEGCNLYVNDLNINLVELAVREFGVQHLNISEAKKIEAEVFCPCAFGGSINQKLLDKLSVQYIIGSANNQLENPSIAELLFQKNIVYIPDFLSNSGGVIDIFCEGDSYSETFVFKEVGRIYKKTRQLLKISDRFNINPLVLANQFVKKNLKPYYALR